VIEANVTSKQLVGEFLAWSSGRLRSVPRQRSKGDKIGLYRVRPTKIVMPISTQIWSDKEEETMMLPSISGAEWHYSEPSQTQGLQQNFSLDIASTDFAPVGAVRVSGRAPSDDSADDPEGQGEDRQAKTKAQKITAVAPIDLPQMAEFIIYVEMPSLGTTRRLNSGAFHGKLNDLYERGLIARESVRAAMRLADDRRLRKIV